MTRLTTLDLSPFYRNTVGIDRLFDRITSQLDAAATGGNFPPYDIVKVAEDRYEIRVAVAGFELSDIDIEFHEGQLVVQGRREQTSPMPEVEYVHHGISNRAWARQWTLADYIEVKGATMKNGILTIALERQVPEAMKPKKIPILSQE